MSKIEIPVVVGQNVAIETDLPACRVLVVSGIESGAGKSTISRHCLKPLMLDHFSKVEYLTVEDPDRISTGQDGTFNPDEISQVIAKLARLRAGRGIVLEVGSQLFASVMTELKKLEAGAFKFDKVVVPMPYGTFKSETAVGFIAKLVSMGIDPKSIYLVFNQVEADAVDRKVFERQLANEHKEFLDVIEKMGAHVFEHPILKSSIYPTLRFIPGEAFSVINLSRIPEQLFTDAANQAEDDGDGEAEDDAMAMIVLRSQAAGAAPTFQALFDFVF